MTLCQECRPLLINAAASDTHCDIVAFTAARPQHAHDLEDMQGIEDTSILEDLAEAEEEYDRPEQVLTHTC